MIPRRKLLTGLGALTAGSVAAVGTTVLTTPTTAWTAQVTTTADTRNYTSIAATSSYASETESGQLELRFSNTHTQRVFRNRNGLNPGVTYTFENVFEIAHHTTGDDVRVICTTAGFDLEQLAVETDQQGSLLADAYTNPIDAPSLGQSDSLTVNITIQTNESTPTTAEGTLTLHAASGTEYMNREFSALF